jgi:hypothetical protein
VAASLRLSPSTPLQEKKRSIYIYSQIPRVFGPAVMERIDVLPDMERITYEFNIALEATARQVWRMTCVSGVLSRAPKIKTLLLKYM